jgi:hypothetical protein
MADTRICVMVPVMYRDTFVVYAYSGDGFSEVRERVLEKTKHNDFWLLRDDGTPFLNGHRVTGRDTKLIIKRSPKHEEYADSVVMAVLMTPDVQ